MLQKVRQFSQRLPDKKRYFEFVTALLTIPVMLTVLITNVNNLQSQQKSAVPTPPTASLSAGAGAAPTASPRPTRPSATGTPTPTVNPAQCKREIGPVSIINPDQDQTVTGDPVCIDVAREGSDYCAVVWSYRINGGGWSDYTDKSICLYSLSAGNKHLELRVKSVVTGEERVLERSFAVAGSDTQQPESSASASP